MASNLKLILVAGARPNFMKIAPIIRAIDRHNASCAPEELRIDRRLVHTGQHYDVKMSELFFTELGLPTPDINLEVGSGSHALQTAEVMRKFEPVCLEYEPDWVIVVGDVNSTMACTLVASKLGIKVAHVEAGLRSFDRTMPEEINRLVTDALADLLLTPSSDADENLAREGVDASKICLVGNVMIDTLVDNLEKARKAACHTRLGLESGRFVFVTLHRPSNVDEPDTLTTIMAALKELSRDLPVVFPMHPRTRTRLDEFEISLDDADGLRVIYPVGYHDSLCLSENARFVLTDSGGLQEETTYLGTPCLTLRPNTERPITITMGTNRLTSLDDLADDIASAMIGYRKNGKRPPLWDGRCGERIVRRLLA